MSHVRAQKAPWSAQWEKSEFFDRMRRDDAHHSLSLSRSHSLAPLRHLSLSGAQSALINNAYLRARTGEKSTAVATRRVSPRTPAIAHTYLYTVIFKMKERRADGRIAVVRALTEALEEIVARKGRMGDGDQSHFHRVGLLPSVDDDDEVARHRIARVIRDARTVSHS